jgi:hypothetical protein
MSTSPVEDFRNGTLGAVPGTLAKLQYLASLRNKKGNYYHWGLAREHGEAAASAVIGDAHTDVLISVLRTPIRSLWEEAKSMAADRDEPVGDYLRELTELGEALVPKELQGGVKRHFMSVLLALCSLAGVRVPLKTGLAA